LETEDCAEVSCVASQELLIGHAEERSRPVVEVRDEVDAGVPRPPDGRVERGEQKKAARGVPWRGEIHPVEVRTDHLLGSAHRRDEGRIADGGEVWRLITR